jgi:hypothetical protein
MASIAETLMLEVLWRLKTQPVITNVDNIRRDHRTIIPRTMAPAVHLIDGAETPLSRRNYCFVDDDLIFTVAIFVRDDAGYAAADPIKQAVMAALDPASAYPAGPTGRTPDLLRGRITSAQEIADADALRVDMEFTFKFQALLWGL